MSDAPISGPAAAAYPTPVPAPTQGWFASTFDSLTIRPYRILWLGTVLSFVAFMMSNTAQGVVAYDLTGSNRAVGWVGFGQGIAMLGLMPFGGAIADRLSKRFLLLFGQSSIGLSMLLLGILIRTDAITIFFLACGAFITGTMFSFIGPTRTAYIGELVPPERRGNAIALTQVGMNMTRVFGPFAAGGLLAWAVVGKAGVYFIMAGIFVFVVATLAQLPPSVGKSLPGRSVMGDIRLGVQHVAANPRLKTLILGFLTVTVLGFPYMVVLPGLTKDQLHAGDAGYGTLVGVSSIGGLAMSLVVASLADSQRATLYLTLSSLGLGVALILTGLAPTFPVALLTMMLVGGAGSAFQTLNNAIALREAQPEYFGRVMSLMMLAWSFNGLIGLPIGLLADEIGERHVLIVMGVAVMAGVALLAMLGSGEQASPPAEAS